MVLNIVDVHQLPKNGWLGMQCRKKPDLDNAMKLVADALNGVAYRDDAQIEKATLLNFVQKNGEEVDPWSLLERARA